MHTVTSVSDLPNLPAVYCMYGGQGRSGYAAYVGVADALRTRITQHLIRRDSSVTTGAAAVSLNPALITRVDWWQAADFAQRQVLEAAEVVALTALDPVLRGRSAVRVESARLAADAAFRQAMTALFTGPPSGRLLIETLADALARITTLERRLATLEARLTNTPPPTSSDT